MGSSGHSVRQIANEGGRTMSRLRQTVVLLVLATAGMMTPLGRVHAGTITGTLYELDGVTVISPASPGSGGDTITVEALDWNQVQFSTRIKQDCTTSTYTLVIP